MAGWRGEELDSVRGCQGVRISPEAVRKQIARGTLGAEKQDGEPGRVYLDDVPTTDTDRTEDESHFGSLLTTKQKLRAASAERRKARVDMLIERIPPQLPAPEQDSGQDKVRHPWWRRIFFNRS